MEKCHVCGGAVAEADEGLLLAPSGIVTVHRACGESVKGNPEWIASEADIERMQRRMERRIEEGGR
jgi:hypothetical protein